MGQTITSPRPGSAPLTPGGEAVEGKMRIAVLITCFNRKEKPLRCLRSMDSTLRPYSDRFHLKIFLTDDGCSDGTADAVRAGKYLFPVEILQGTGELFWNGGMINSWNAAIAEGGFDGYLWINDDISVLPEFWPDLLDADAFSLQNFGKRGIYAGSTKDAVTGALTYGGFVYTNKFTLKDRLTEPDGSFRECESAHGNITYVAREVVEKMGVFCKDYIHGGADHDYTFLARRAGFPLLVLPHYSAVCENDHIGKTRSYTKLPLRERARLFWSPKGYNMHNTLLFNRRCFPWRVPFAFFAGVGKMLFPGAGYKFYLLLRGVWK